MHVSMKMLLAVKACRLSAFYVYAFIPIYLYWVYKLFSVFRSVQTALDVSFSWWKRELHSLEVLQYFLSGLNNSQKRAKIWQLELIWVGRKYFFSSNAVRSLPQVEAFIWIWITVSSGHPSPELPFRNPVWWACLRWQSIHSAWAELCCLQNNVLYAWHPSSLKCMETIFKLFLSVQPVCWQKGYDIFRSKKGSHSPLPEWEVGKEAAPCVPVRMLLPSAVGEPLLAQIASCWDVYREAVNDEVDLAGSCPAFAASSKGFCAKKTSACWLAACLVLQVNHSPGSQTAWILAKDLVNVIDCSCHVCKPLVQ